MNHTCSLCGQAKPDGSSLEIVVGAFKPFESAPGKNIYGDFRRLEPFWFCSGCWAARQIENEKDLLYQGLLAIGLGTIGSLLWFFMRDQICLLGFPVLVGGLLLTFYALYARKKPTNYSEIQMPSGNSLQGDFAEILPFIVLQALANRPEMRHHNAYWELSLWESWQKQPGNVICHPSDVGIPSETASPSEVENYRERVEKWRSKGQLEKALREVLPQSSSSACLTIQASVLEDLGRTVDAQRTYRIAWLFNSSNTIAFEGERRTRLKLNN